MGLYGAYELLHFDNSFAEKVALYISNMIDWSFIFMQVFLKVIGFYSKKKLLKKSKIGTTYLTLGFL